MTKYKVEEGVLVKVEENFVILKGMKIKKEKEKEAKRYFSERKNLSKKYEKWLKMTDKFDAMIDGLSASEVKWSMKDSDLKMEWDEKIRKKWIDEMNKIDEKYDFGDFLYKDPNEWDPFG